MRRILVVIAITLASFTATWTPAAQTPNADHNPLLAKWTGFYDGVPPFDKIRIPDFKPALETGMDENLREIEVIANNTAPPTFTNTIEAMERSGAALTRASICYGIWSSTMSTDEFRSVETEMDPKLAAFNDKITQNEKLFKRIEAVYNSPEKAKLTPEQQRLTWVYYDNFVRYGARLDATAKARLAQINQRLATLFTNFNQNLLGDETEYVLYLNETDLAGIAPVGPGGRCGCG